MFIQTNTNYSRLCLGSGGQLAQDLDPSLYRVLCRNGTLAQNVGLNVDNECALSYGIGSEVSCSKIKVMFLLFLLFGKAQIRCTKGAFTQY